MNEQHPEDELTELQSATESQHDNQEQDDTPEPESTFPARRSTEEVSTTDATDQLAQIVAKPKVWGTVLCAIMIIAVLWAYFDSVSNEISFSEGWSSYHQLAAKFTNLQVDTAQDVDAEIDNKLDAMTVDGSLPWAKLFKANLLLQKALMPDASAPRNPLNPSGNKPSLLSGNLDLRRSNLEQAIVAFNEVVTLTRTGKMPSLDNIAKFRAYYGIAYCEEALMIVGDPDDFPTHKSKALSSWKTAMDSVNNNAGNARLSKLIADHYDAVLEMSVDDWDEGDSLTEGKLFSWLSKNDPTVVLDPADDPLNPENILDDRGETTPASDENRESALPEGDAKPEGDA
jgi:hypothetical protein